MPRIKLQLSDGIKRVVTFDTDATKGAQLGANVYLPSGQVATPATFRDWLGVTQGSGSGGSSNNFGPGTNGDVWRLAGGIPQWQSPQALSRVDDTNITLTLGGSPTTALLGATSITAGWAGTLAAPRGGTGFGVYTVGDLLYASATNALSKLGIGSTGYVLEVVGGVPSWAAPAALTKTDDTNVTLSLGGSPTTALLNAASLTLGWAGQLAVARGGSGAATLTGYLKGNGTAAFTASSTIPAGDISGGAALTKADDTNVTLTLGGTPASALLTAASLTLGWTGQLGPTRGGTGIGTYTTGDILYSSASNVLSKLGIGSSGNVLTVAGGVPTWAAPSGGATGANPTASVGLTAVNGSAGTFLRSDGAPALSQGIAPTWTATHVFGKAATSSLTGAAVLNSTVPLLAWYESGAAANAKLWDMVAVGGQFVFRARNDADNASRDIIAVSRSGIGLTTMNYGNATDNPAHTFYGVLNVNSPTNGLVATVAANQYGFFGSTGTVSAGMYFNGTTSVQMGAASNHRLDFFANGAVGLSLATDGRLYGAALHNNAGAVTGTTNQYIASGTYTPTLTGVTNVDSTSAYVCQWIRVGNVVTVSGKIQVDATLAATTTVVGVSLPIASALTAQEQLGGAGCGLNSVSPVVSCAADATNDRANFRFVANINSSEDYTFTFTYLVL